MPAAESPTYLLASHEPALLEALEPVLASFGAKVEIVLSAMAALDVMKGVDAPDMALVDACLPGMEMGSCSSRPVWRQRGRVSQLSQFWTL
jgi:CheY-like chemotaxis protein